MKQDSYVCLHMAQRSQQLFSVGCFKVVALIANTILKVSFLVITATIPLQFNSWNVLDDTFVSAHKFNFIQCLSFYHISTGVNFSFSFFFFYFVLKISSVFETQFMAS